MDAPDNAGWTPLHEAANFGHAELVGFLLKCGAKANAQSIDRETPLHDAALSGHEEICKRLLSYDANPLNVNKDGEWSVIYAHAYTLVSRIAYAFVSRMAYTFVSRMAYTFVVAWLTP